MFAVVLKLASGGGSKLQEKREKTMDGLKELFKDAYEKGKEALEKAEEIERQERITDVGIRFLQQQMEDLAEMRHHVTWAQFFLRDIAGDTISGLGDTADMARLHLIWANIVGYPQPYHRKRRSPNFPPYSFTTSCVNTAGGMCGSSYRVLHRFM